MLWPETTDRTADGQLRVGGVPLPAIAAEFGTPVYVFDEATLRGRARRFREAFRAAYPRSRVVYAGKAYLSLAILRLLREEGLGLDVVSGGELYAGLRAGVPAAEIAFHGNNKSEAELREAIAAGVGTIVVDNAWELALLTRLTAERPAGQAIMLRLNPGIDADTHAKIRTGSLDSKFGLPIETGDAEAAVRQALAAPGLRLTGYHAHIGSQLFDPAPYVRTANALMEFAAAMRDRHGVVPTRLSPGGGFGIAYEAGRSAVNVEQWARATAGAVETASARHGLPLPELIVEPGRAIVGPAGVALYRVGAIKEIGGVRRYVAVDGGMADNIRPALYGARYTAELANRRSAEPAVPVTIAGKYCEAGDLLIEEIELPPMRPGDLVAMPAAGAYSLPLASNYNMAPRPPVVLVHEGQIRLIRRRETYADLLRREVE